MSEVPSQDTVIPGRRGSDVTGDSPRQGRRASDRVDTRGVARMIEVLAARPTPDDLARELALGTLARFKPKAVMLGHLASSAQLQLVGSFGLSDASMSTLQARSIWDGSAMSEAVRTGALVRMESPANAKEGSWEHDAEESIFPVIAIPLALQGRKLGALALGVDGESSNGNLADELSGIADVLALYVSLRFEAPPSNGHVGANTNAGSSEAVDDQREIPAMTERRKEVLRLMAMGMTNSQIAHRIGYSESTVRHETIALYRILGAKSRGEASRIAETQGLIEQ